MLGKLLKYDLKWCYKPLLVFYILALFFAVVTRALGEIENSFIFFIIEKICTGILIVMLINILVNNFMRVWARFVRNVYKGESYLTHTLPVSKHSIFLSKVLSAIITMLTSVAVMVLCIVICYYSKENMQIIKDMIEQTAVYFNSSTISFIAVIIITLFFELLFMIFAGYIGIIKGHKSNNMKIVKSVIYGFIAYVIPSVLVLGIIYILGMFNPEIMELFNNTTNLSTEAIKSLLYCGIGLYIIYDIIYYILGMKMINKGIDVD